MRGLEVLEVLHRAAPAAGVRHQSEPDLVLAVAVVRRDAVSLSFGAAHSFIEKNPEQAPDLSDLAAAAAAAADDTHPGLDLPLLTFSCIVGIKLSQATYYLRSQDLVAALLAQLADCASVSQDD